MYRIKRIRKWKSLRLRQVLSTKESLYIKYSHKFKIFHTLKFARHEIMNRIIMNKLARSGSHLTTAILPALVMSSLNQTIALKCQYKLDNT